ncbi:ABC transporter permease [Xanthomonas albilineans]|uniref:ABC transporter permease n=1 Tax=Xanthomonas albilineans TaxID=29447 RepID=UPI0005F34202|nr:ABC transporter permease [Xanthomonas albilineans]
MSYPGLIHAFLWYRRTRFLLSFAAIALAFALFGTVSAVRSAFTAHAGEGTNRLVVTSLRSVAGGLPTSIASQIQSHDTGVSIVAWASWIGGYYQTPKNPILNLAISDHYLDLYPEFHIDAPTLSRFSTTRDGVIVGRQLAQSNGWTVGQRISLLGSPFVNKTGRAVWTYEVAGFFSVEDQALRGLENQFFSHWSYFNESAVYANASAGWLIAKVPSANVSEEVARRIDHLTLSSPNPTKTQTEQAFQLQMINQVANIGDIAVTVMIVSFLLLWALASKVVSHAIKERSREYGILKSMGYGGAVLFGLLLGETFWLVANAGLAGMLLATVVHMVVGDHARMSFVLQPIGASTWGLSAVAVLALTCAAVLPPGLRLARASPCQLLRGL